MRLRAHPDDFRGALLRACNRDGGIIGKTAVLIARDHGTAYDDSRASNLSPVDPFTEIDAFLSGAADIDRRRDA